MVEDLDELTLRRFLADPTKVEVLSWLRGSAPDEERTLGELATCAESVALAEEIYAAGAREVLAVDIQEYPHSCTEGGYVRLQNTGKLIVALPDEASARKRVFRWEKSHARSLGFDGYKDMGQKHLFVMLD